VLLIAALVGGVSGGLVAHFAEKDTNTTENGAAASTPPPPSTALPDIPTIISDISESVVTIDVKSRVSFGPRTIEQEAAGTGFVFSSNGLIATNAHVVEGASSISVQLPDGSSLVATLVGSDATHDLALIHIDRADLVPMPLGNSSDLQVGDLVIAVGNALALEGGPTASMGIVSALGRTVTTAEGDTLSHLIQTDAAINEGNSGGPLTDRAGDLVGINTIASTGAENIGFAIAIDDALPVLQALQAGGNW
jgi:putative serine protease PepD